MHCDGFDVGSRERIESEAKLMTYCVRTWSALVSRWESASVTTVKDSVWTIWQETVHATPRKESQGKMRIREEYCMKMFIIDAMFVMQMQS